MKSRSVHMWALAEPRICKKIKDEDDANSVQIAWSFTEQTHWAEPRGPTLMSVNVHCEYTVAGESVSSEETVSEPVNLTSRRPHVSQDKCFVIPKSGWQTWVSPNCEKSIWHMLTMCLHLLVAVQNSALSWLCVYDSVFVIVYCSWSWQGNT